MIASFIHKFAPLNRLAALVHQIREAAANLFPKISPLDPVSALH